MWLLGRKKQTVRKCAVVMSDWTCSTGNVEAWSCCYQELPT
jgi:hypothetical protein